MNVRAQPLTSLTVCSLMSRCRIECLGSVGTEPPICALTSVADELCPLCCTGPCPCIGCSCTSHSLLSVLAAFSIRSRNMRTASVVVKCLEWGPVCSKAKTRAYGTEDSARRCALMLRRNGALKSNCTSSFLLVAVLGTSNGLSFCLVMTPPMGRSTSGVGQM